MKIGYALGVELTGLALRLYEWICEAGYAPEFIICTEPVYHESESFKGRSDRYYSCGGINSTTFSELMSAEKPRAVVVFGCGIVQRRVAERFDRTLINAHAGVLPEFRGVNNVEWAYFENKPVVGTVHFIAPNVDSGDVIHEETLEKLPRADSIEEIRNHAFEQTFKLIPKALSAIDQGTSLRQQIDTSRTNRYVMHPFIKQNILLARLRSGRF